MFKTQISVEMGWMKVLISFLDAISLALIVWLMLKKVKFALHLQPHIMVYFESTTLNINSFSTSKL